MTKNDYNEQVVLNLNENYEILCDLIKNNGIHKEQHSFGTTLKQLKLEETQKQLILKNSYKYFLNEYRNNLKKYNNTQNEDVDSSFLKIGNIFEMLHGCYSQYNLDNVKNMCYLLNKNKNDNSKNITITTTTCKRIDLFKRTVNSFIECCSDLHLVKEWIVIDDNSNDCDRLEMKTLYPFITFIFKNEHEKGHIKSMNLIRNLVQTEYLFNLEDDWEFFYKDDYLSKCLQVINIKPEYGQCLINKNYGEGYMCFETVGGKLKSYIKDDFVQQFYFEHEHIENSQKVQMELQKYENLRKKQKLMYIKQ
jgi:hypothetical protein